MFVYAQKWVTSKGVAYIRLGKLQVLALITQIVAWTPLANTQPAIASFCDGPTGDWKLAETREARKEVKAKASKNSNASPQSDKRPCRARRYARTSTPHITSESAQARRTDRSTNSMVLESFYRLVESTKSRQLRHEPHII